MVTTKDCFLFPGQGAQYPRMGLDFFTRWGKAKELFQMASDIACVDFYERLSNATEVELARTGLQQPAVTLVNIVASAYLRENGAVVSGTAGFSLGEFSAYAAAGVFTVEDALLLVSERARAMDGACRGFAEKGDATGMAAVIGLESGKVGEALEGMGEVWAANFNSPDQTVVSGRESALAKAEERLKAAGAKRVIRLRVSGPFHTPLLSEANAAFSSFMDRIPFADPGCILFSGVTGDPVKTGGEAKSCLLRQMTSPVLWTSVEASVSGLGFGRLLETGPGKALAGMWKTSGLEGELLSAGKFGECAALSGVDTGETACA